MAQDALVLCDVTACYDHVPAIHHIDTTVPCGTLTAVMGANGAGKSSLLKAILGLMPLTTGHITLGGIDRLRTRRRIAYLPQRSSIDWDFPLTVREVVAQGRYPAIGWWKPFTANDLSAVDRAIGELGLDRVADRAIAALSGGQQQRVLLARALASGADVLLLDEPFTGLDVPTTSDLVHRLRAWAAAGRLVLATVHDVELARRSFQHALLLRTHLVAAGPVAEVLSQSHLLDTYGPGQASVQDGPPHG